MAKHFEKFYPKHKEHVRKKLKTYDISLTIGFIGLGFIVLGAFLSCLGYIQEGAFLIPTGLIAFIISLILTFIHRKSSKKERKIMQEKGEENEKILPFEKGFRFSK